MKFRRTVASLFQPVSEMSIVREHEIANLLQIYEAEQESSVCPDRTLLYRARTLLEENLAQHLDRELVELGHIIYRSLGAWHQEIALLQQYLSVQQLNQDEQAWARWHIVDCLALAGDASESVCEQQAFFHWATTTFPLEDCFFVIADGTQARSWFTTGRGHEWLHHYDHFSDQAPHTMPNRLDRFYCLRTAVHLCLWMSETARVRHSYIPALHTLQQEDMRWGEHRWINVEISILEIALAEKCGEMTQVRALAQKVIEDMQEWEHHLNLNEHSEVGRYRSLCHNIAAPLYRARQYDLAIPLLAKTIHYHTLPHYSYLWLAASLWQTTHQREQVFPYLQQAAARYDGEGHPWDMFQKLPEFQDVQRDSEFLAATTLL